MDMALKEVKRSCSTVLVVHRPVVHQIPGVQAPGH